MTLETYDGKLHIFLFLWPAPTLCFETFVFIIWRGGKILSFKLAGKSSSEDILYHLHISITPSSTECGGKKGEIRCAQNGLLV